jgi:hypothetical protein
MINTQYLPFTSDDLDVKKIFEFEGSQFKFRLRNNEQTSILSLEVFDVNDDFVFSGPLIYKKNFVDSKYPELPFQIVPLDITELADNLNHETSVTVDNIGVTVQLYTGVELV